MKKIFSAPPIDCAVHMPLDRVKRYQSSYLGDKGSVGVGGGGGDDDVAPDRDHMACAAQPSDSQIATKTTTNYFIQTDKKKKRSRCKKEYKQAMGREYGYTYLCS
jgi:hypothetical protein